MTARTLVLTTLALVAAGAMCCGIWAAVRAHGDQVTLRVQDMPVRQVVKRIQWQTWESIHVHRDVQGRVTLDVRNLPIEEVLRRVADQTASRSSALYPLYSGSKSLDTLKQALRGEIDPADHGWTNLLNRALLPLGPVFGAPAHDEDLLVSLEIQDKDVESATVALAALARVCVVPEDGTCGRVNLKWDATPIPEAVSQLARQVHRRWAKLYMLRSEPSPNGKGGAGGVDAPPSPAPRLEADLSRPKAPATVTQHEASRLRRRACAAGPQRAGGAQH